MERARDLEIWEEAVGKLRKVMVHDGAIFVYLNIGILKIPYQKEFMEKLKGLKGKRIAILHTDIKGKDFLIREVDNGRR